MNALIAALLLMQAAPQPDAKKGEIDVVFCIDRSGSMQEVINTAKEKVWGIVSEIAKSKPTPVLRIGLIGYGSADKDFKFFELTDDLDTVYKNLMTFMTDMGGDEWVGAVVKKAVDEMSWSASKDALKLIFVVGNETAAQGREDVMYTKTVPEAIKKDIMVNAIYCGNPGAEEQRTWMEVSKLADGAFTTIDLSGGAITIPTPMDKELVDLNTKLNATYLPYGKHGAEGQKNQVEQDANSHSNGGYSNGAQRAQAKAWSGYNCRAWDLVDASKGKDFKLEDVKAEELPKDMQSMTLEERRGHIAKKGAERDDVNKQINETAQKRQKFIDDEIKAKGLSQSSAFDEAVRATIRSQGAKRGYTFEEKK